MVIRPLAAVAAFVATMGGAHAQSTVDVVYATPNDVATLEPTQVQGFSDHTSTLAIFGALTFNFDGKTGEVGYKPFLAEAIDPVDPNIWRIKLREGMSFHNGAPLNAEAVKFSFDRIRQADFPSGRYMKSAPIESVEIVDDLTVDVHTTEPIAIFPARLLRADGYVVEPGHYADAPPWERISETAFDPVGAGPFRFVSHEPDNRLILEVNDAFKDPRGYPAPNFDRLILRVIPEPSTLVAELLQGTVDIAPIPSEMVRVFEEAPNLRVVTSPSTTRLSFMINQAAHPALSDRRVRQAINHAIDVEALRQTLTGGQGVRIASLVNPPNANPSLRPYNHDPDRSRALLRDAGHADGFALTIDWSAAPACGALATAVVPYLEAVGIAVEAVRERDWATEYLPGQVAGTLGGLHGHGHAGVEMTAETDLWPIHPEREANSTNWTGPAADRFVRLYRKLQQTTDPDRQRDLGHALQAITHDEAISVPFWQMPRHVAVSDRVAHFRPYPGGHNEDFWSIRMSDGASASGTGARS
ncbi:ABC transporter substrate-binding protein [Meridianimarinicoccus sp. RP-17]|uniref:ABC transporter substrate-binding protein n=1 Tax=Meridianimarinicoccus zhengii TaxID=2056810 RepID=UPI0013A6B6D7|nr:ABC transporter substrate-binding protein [Phycocomes zhengii]